MASFTAALTMDIFMLLIQMELFVGNTIPVQK